MEKQVNCAFVSGTVVGAAAAVYFLPIPPLAGLAYGLLGGVMAFVATMLAARLVRRVAGDQTVRGGE